MFLPNHSGVDKYLQNRNDLGDNEIVYFLNGKLQSDPKLKWNPVTEFFDVDGNAVLTNNNAFGIRLVNNLPVLVFSINTDDNLIVGNTLINDIYVHTGDKPFAVTLKGTTGYMGKGTLDPQANVHLVENSASSVETLRLDNINTGNNIGNSIKWFAANQANAAGCIDVYRNGAGFDFFMDLCTTDNLLTTAASPQIRILGDGTVLIGDLSTNYSEFKPDGEWRAYGTAKVKKHVHLPLNDFLPGAQAPTANTIGHYSGYNYSQAVTQTATTVFHVPEDWDKVSDMLIHVHWAPTDGAAGDVVWDVDYKSTASEANEVLTGTQRSLTTTDSTQSLQDE
jgi:hypothetical protein